MSLTSAQSSDRYCRREAKNSSGEIALAALDFFVRVLGLSFHDAMRAITGR